MAGVDWASGDSFSAFRDTHRQSLRMKHVPQIPREALHNRKTPIR